jgi:hypothetical protein
MARYDEPAAGWSAPDACTEWGGGETVLTRASNASFAWSRYDDTARGSRGGMIPVIIYMGNHRYAGTTAEPNLAIMFKNSVAWLVRL